MKTLFFIFGIMAIFYLWLLLRFIVFHAKFCRPYHRIPEMFFLRGTALPFLGLGGYFWGQYCLGLDHREMGLKLSFDRIDWFYIGLAVVVIPILAIIHRRQNRTLWEYPVIRAKNWTVALILLSAVSWAVYLFVFEFFFRGVFFSGLLHYLGADKVLLSALLGAVIYCVLYASAHFYENLKIVPIAALFAFGMNLISYHTGSILTAVLIHVLNAWIFEWITLCKHPEMRVSGII